jgi:hypothetical protein
MQYEEREAVSGMDGVIEAVRIEVSVRGPSGAS